VGSIVAFPVDAPPPGFLELDNSVKSSATYPDLSAYLGSKFNKGDEGVGNFRLPEARGEFLRGWDHGRGVDAGRAIGSYQLDAFQNITGTVSTDGVNSGPNGVFGSQPGAPQVATATIASTTSLLTFDAARVARTATETRPRNIAVMWCIKAWNAPVNQGTIDVAALAKEVERLKSAVPVGAVLAFPTGIVAPGYLELDGSVQSIATYPDLAAYLGTTYNKGNEGAGNFRLPESRGEFLRGWDHGRGVDAGRSLGSWQKATLMGVDAVTQDGLGVQSVSAAWKVNADGSGNSHAFVGGDLVGSAAYIGAGISTGVPPSALFQADEAQYTRGTLVGTRPRNLAVMWCIKAWNAPINQGSIDIAALSVLAQQASETNQGTAKVATQNQTDSGTDDTVMVSPKKLRLGFEISLAANGYIIFPSWLGGLMLQWGLAIMPGTSANFSFPIAFRNNVFQMIATDGGGGAHSLGVSPTTTGFSAWGNVPTTNIRYLAIGN
jgi:microcystin-dependent protein